MLVVEREGEAARALVAALREQGAECAWAHDAEGAAAALARVRPDALVCPLRAPRTDGLAVLAAVRARRPDACAIMISDGPELELAVEAMRRGATDVQERPVHAGRLLAALARGLEHLALAERAHALEGELDRRGRLEALAGNSRAIRRAREQIAQVANTRATVLIEGEEGTGKSVVARALHRRSGRADGPFVRLECGSVPPEMVEAELLGVEQPGEPARPGRVELADGGTLVLDGVEHLSARAQLRLLRLLQDRAFERVGGARTHRVDVRVLATTQVDLAAEARAGRFRQDLFRLLAVVRVALPPLRERREDIPVLAERLLRDLAHEHGRRVRGLTRGVVDRLVAHDWPGNVAELERVLEGLVVAAHGRAPVDVSSLPAGLRGAERAAPRLEIEVGMTVEEAERALIEATLRRTGGDKRRAADMLAIGLRTLYRKLERYGGR